LLDRVPHPWGFLTRGQAFAAYGNIERSLPDFERAIAIYPPMEHEASKEIAVAYLGIGDPVSAEPYLLRSLRAEPHCTHCWTKLGELYSLHLKDSAKVAEAIRSALDGTEELSTFRGCALETIGLYDDALAEYTSGMQATPDSPWAHCMRGQLHARLGQWDEARRDAEAALLLFPRYVPGLNLRSRAREHEGDADGAREDLELTAGAGRTASALNTLGVLQAQCGRFDDALSTYAEASEADDGSLSWMITYNIAVARTLRDGIEAGREARASALSSVGPAPGLRYVRAGLLAVEGAAESAVAALKEIRRTDPELAETAWTDPAWSHVWSTPAWNADFGETPGSTSGPGARSTRKG
jgi:tetratricopeptide (TPR) repeat protein